MKAKLPRLLRLLHTLVEEGQREEASHPLRQSFISQPGLAERPKKACIPLPDRLV